MNPRYPVIAQRANHRCEYCRAPEALFNFPFEVEHILPTSQGGQDNEANLALACRACNIHKADCTTTSDALTQAEVLLFNPRLNRWQDHFELEIETGSIRGLTPMGRGSVARLQMNSGAQQAARIRWTQLGLFP
ncbi:MAG: HNH endonuclease signature motif containing protein [Acidobacteriota bacterium]